MYFIRRHSRRDFVKSASIAIAGHRSRWLQAAAPANQIDLKDCVLVTSQNPTSRESKALTVLAEEAAKRSGLGWQGLSSSKSTAAVTIYAGLASGLAKLGPRMRTVTGAGEHVPEAYAIHVGSDSSGRWIAVAGSDERGGLFGVGQILRSMTLGL